jgi:hypothetical protein
MTFDLTADAVISERIITNSEQKDTMKLPRFIFSRASM